MNVYQITGWGSYGGGMAIIAARDEHRAKEVSKTIIDSIWHTNYADGDIELIDADDERLEWHGNEAVITHFETGE